MAWADSLAYLWREVSFQGIFPREREPLRISLSMKVVHCITGLTADGAQRVLLRLSIELQKRGFQNYVVSLDKREPFAEI